MIPIFPKFQNRFWLIKSNSQKLILIENRFWEIDNRKSILAWLIDFWSTLINFSFPFQQLFLYFSVAFLNDQLFQFFDFCKDSFKWSIKSNIRKSIKKFDFWPNWNQKLRNEHYFGLCSIIFIFRVNMAWQYL